MDSIWKRIDAVSDVRTKGWFLVDSPIQLVLLIAMYAVVVTFGPVIMKNRKPLGLQRTMLIYNVAMCLLNSVILFHLMGGALLGQYNPKCEPLRPHDKSMPDMLVANGIWLYFISKPMELLDSLFFILRKKTAQLSFLHVYHHSTIIIVAWVSCKWAPTGSSFLAPAINSFIHIVMYGYYALTTNGRTLWWKRYITILQMWQFVFTLLWSAFNVFMAKSCTFPKWPHVISIFYMASFINLFGQFYNKAYVKCRKLL